MVKCLLRLASYYTHTSCTDHQGLLVIPRSELKTKEDCAFEVLAPKLWRALPLHLRSVDSTELLCFINQLYLLMCLLSSPGFLKVRVFLWTLASFSQIFYAVQSLS